MEHDDGESKTKRQFEAAVKVVQNLPRNGSFKPANELLLKFYAFYKQATVGKCTAAKPSFWDLVGKAKWEAWDILGNMSSKEAMQGYVSELTKIVEMMPQTEEVSGLVNELDSFYELVNIRTGEPVKSVTKYPADTDSDSSGAGADAGRDKIKHMNGHLPGHNEPSHNIPTDIPASDRSPNELNSPDLVSQSNGMLELDITSKAGAATSDLVTGAPTPIDNQISTDEILHSPMSGSAASAGSTESAESDADSDELYMDSSDVPSLPHVMNNSQIHERTVDLLASCPSGSGSDLPSGTTRSPSQPLSDRITSSDFTEPVTTSTPLLSHLGTRSKGPVSKSYKHNVTFCLPEGGRSGSPSSTEEVNEKLRMALLNMQQEMNSLEQRLKVVEQMTVNQRKRQIQENPQYMRWWPFRGLQPRTAMLVFVWPVFVVWLMRYMANRRRRP